MFRSIVRQVEDHARSQPHHIAMVCNGSHLTHAELNRRANQLARHLRATGAPRDVPVALCVERSIELVVGLLGILKAGFGYLPIDPRLPKARRELMLADSKVRCAVTQSSLGVDGVPLLVQLDRERGAIARQDDHDLDVAIAPGDLCVAMYTSGTTGTPKCVLIGHASVAAYPAALAPALRLTTRDRVLHAAAFSFVASVRQLLVALAAGATVVLATQDQLRDPVSLLELAAAEEITVLDTVPSFHEKLLSVLVTLPEARGLATGLAKSLRLVVASGEPLPWDLVRRARETFGRSIEIVNLYGLTETTGIVAYHLAAANEGSEGHVPIGRPAPGSELRLLGPDDRLLAPDGEATGELCVVGTSLALGFLDQPELTRERFIDASGDRMCRTGDVARRRADGIYEALSRKDHQVKINGIRIELGEIEVALRANPAIAEAVVVPRSDEHGNLRLATYYRVSSPVQESVLRASLKNALPDSMVPTFFVELAELPRTTSGKINRQALAVDGQAPRAATPAPVADLITPLVERVFKRALGLETIDHHGDFFELGGDSLLAIQVVTELVEALPIDLPLLAAFFSEPTVAGLTTAIHADAGDQGVAEIMAHLAGASR